MTGVAAPRADAITTSDPADLTRYLRPAAGFTVAIILGAGALLPTTGTHDVVNVLPPGTGWWRGGEATELSDMQQSTAERVADLKGSSGLTWSQLAALFGVSRRAVHHWVQGGNMTAANVARLDALQLRLSEHMFASRTAARSWLFGLEPDGRSRYATWVGELTTPSAMERIGTVEQQIAGAEPAAYIAQELSTVKRERIRLVDE